MLSGVDVFLEAVTAPAPSSASSWVTLAGGIGIGSLVTGLVGGGVAVWNSNRQRQHDQKIKSDEQEYDRKVKSDEREHQMALEDLRDVQRLRDARLERLRSGFTQIALAVSDLQDAGQELARGYASPELEVRVVAALESYDAARSRLLLDPRGWWIERDLRPLTTAIIEYQIVLRAIGGGPNADGFDTTEHLEQRQKSLQKTSEDLLVTGRRLLRGIEQMPPTRATLGEFHEKA